MRAKEKGKQVRAKGAKARVSFLNSGLTLEGTPSAAIEGIFTSGLEDINLIQENTRIKAKNIISEASTSAFFNIASAPFSAAGLDSAVTTASNISGFQGGIGGFGGIPFGGFSSATGVKNPLVTNPLSISGT